MICFTVLETSDTQYCLDTFHSVDYLPFEHPPCINHVGCYTPESGFECAMVIPTGPFLGHSCIYFLLMLPYVLRVEFCKVSLYLKVLSKCVYRSATIRPHIRMVFCITWFDWFCSSEVRRVAQYLLCSPRDISAVSQFKLLLLLAMPGKLLVLKHT